MSQQPFSRPGAVDLSALTRPAGAGGAPGGPRPAGAPGAGTGAGGGPAGNGGVAGSYAIEVSEANFQQVLEASMNALVLMVFYSPSQMPASVQLADDLGHGLGDTPR